MVPNKPTQLVCAVDLFCPNDHLMIEARNNERMIRWIRSQEIKCGICGHLIQQIWASYLCGKYRICRYVICWWCQSHRVIDTKYVGIGTIRHKQHPQKALFRMHYVDILLYEHQNQRPCRITLKPESECPSFPSLMSSWKDFISILAVIEAMELSISHRAIRLILNIMEQQMCRKYHRKNTINFRRLKHTKIAENGGWI